MSAITKMTTTSSTYGRSVGISWIKDLCYNPELTVYKLNEDVLATRTLPYGMLRPVGLFQDYKYHTTMIGSGCIH